MVTDNLMQPLYKFYLKKKYSTVKRYYITYKDETINEKNWFWEKIISLIHPMDYMEYTSYTGP